MSLARAVISGTVYRNPEKRFTGNNIPVTTFTIKSDDKDGFLLKITARGNMAETVSQSVSKNDRIAAEGRLQISAVQAEDGSERKIMELDLSSFEIISGSGGAGGAGISASETSASGGSEKKLVEFSDAEMTETLIGEDEIPF